MMKTYYEKKRGDRRDGWKLRDLVFELSLADANEIASSGSALKKIIIANATM